MYCYNIESRFGSNFSEDSLNKQILREYCTKSVTKGLISVTKARIYIFISIIFNFAEILDINIVDKTVCDFFYGMIFGVDAVCWFISFDYCNSQTNSNYDWLNHSISSPHNLHNLTAETLKSHPGFFGDREIEIVCV
jgi:hypothetical protein